MKATDMVTCQQIYQTTQSH